MNRSDAIRLRRAIIKGSESLSDEMASNVPELFPEWKNDISYNVGDRRQYNGVLYKCIQAHTSQADWTPDVAVSLWVRTDDPSIEWPEWRQPTGAQDAYMTGDKVSHNEKHWISNADNNVWEPGVYGWEEVSIE